MHHSVVEIPHVPSGYGSVLGESCYLTADFNDKTVAISFMLDVGIDIVI